MECWILKLIGSGQYICSGDRLVFNAEFSKRFKNRKRAREYLLKNGIPYSDAELVKIEAERLEVEPELHGLMYLK